MNLEHRLADLERLVEIGIMLTAETKLQSVLERDASLAISCQRLQIVREVDASRAPPLDCVLMIL